MLPPRQDDWTVMQPLMFTEQKWQIAKQEVDGVIALLDLHAGASILDMPCGTGRHALELAKRNFKITGIDITENFIAEAKSRSKDLKVQAEWQVGDMLTFRRDQTFDAVINLYTSFGYFRSERENLRVVENFFHNLKPGGKLLMDLMSLEIFQEKLPPHYSKQQEDGSQLDIDHELAADHWLSTRWAVTANGKTKETIRSMKLHSKQELVHMLTKVGFHNFKFFGGFDRSEFSPKAEHLVITCERPY